MPVPSILRIQCGTASIEASDHPNNMKFKGVLVILNEASTRAPHGAEGHKISVSSEVARARLDTLIGMGINYSPELNKHAQQRKVGVINKAWIDGNNLWISGTVWKHDFPEAEKDLKQPGLGMSMELGNVDVKDEKADVWALKDFCFLGATILWKKDAAYYRTRAIAAAIERVPMKTTTQKKKEPVAAQAAEIDVKAIVAAAASATAEALQPTLSKIAKGMGALGARMDAMELDALAGGRINAVVGGSNDSEACNDMKGSKKKDPDDDDDDDTADDGDADNDDEMDSARGAGGDDLDDMGPAIENDEEDNDTPGHFNPNVTNHGDDTTPQEKIGKMVDQGVTGSRLDAALAANRRLAAEVGELKTTVAELSKSVRGQKKQLAAAADKQERKSMTAATDPMLEGLLAKGGLSIRDLQASGRVLTVGDVDNLLAVGMPDLSVMDRMVFKNKLLQAEMMEQGAA
jgi:hypothetical protein